MVTEVLLIRSVCIPNLVAIPKKKKKKRVRSEKRQIRCGFRNNPDIDLA